MNQDPLTAAICKVVDGKDLTPREAEDAMERLISGSASPSQIAALLTALHIKGETVSEIASFARAMYRFCEKVNARVSGILVDTCGTGGDKIKTINVSTAAMFVAAGAGAYVAKHGNRAVTGRVGSADIIEALGARIDLSPDEVRRCIEETGVGFMFAPKFHPATRHVAVVRRELGFRTVFNLLGPLTNPAGVGVQLVGVYDASLCEKIARVLRELGRERAMVVHGLDGVDEISITGRTVISELKDDNLSTRVVSPEDFGLKSARVEEVSGGDIDKNVAKFLRILAGEKGPACDMVLLNAAAVIMLGGKSDDMVGGICLAREVLESGKAYAKLVEFIKATGGNLGRLREWEDKI
ncbi:MAG: anthranilate phosphoribosyltransferase [Candidatus Hadarchaeales archaeon]